MDEVGLQLIVEGDEVSTPSGPRGSRKHQSSRSAGVKLAVSPDTLRREAERWVGGGGVRIFPPLLHKLSRRHISLSGGWCVCVCVEMETMETIPTGNNSTIMGTLTLAALC